MPSRHGPMCERQRYTYSTPSSKFSSTRDYASTMDPILNKYLAIRRACLYEYCAEPTADDAYQYSQQGFAARRLKQLNDDADARNDIPLRLEYALRCLSGWDTNTDGKMCPERALFYLRPVINPTQDIGTEIDSCSSATPPDTSDSDLRLQAHSIAAYAYVKKYYASTSEFQMIAYEALCLPRDGAQVDPLDPLDNIICAVNRANWLARMQFITPAVLMAGFAFKALAKRLQVDYEQFKQFRPLWRALEKREKELWEANRQMKKPTGSSLPGFFVCAASTCPVKKPRTHQMVTPCYGSCPLDMRPSYCSDQCRTSDWPRHRAICCPRESTEIPPTLSLDGRTRDRVVSTMDSKGPVEQLERVLDAEGHGPNPRDGKVLWMLDIPSPNDPNKLERYALKRYE
ncbi:hypothetical protein C8Q70DRAFT_599583 [Cubamyces menziesii]|nr:hypothetical protein C8Q70DRAFT_599583 [Cubamyces menziesii]